MPDLVYDCSFIEYVLAHSYSNDQYKTFTSIEQSRNTYMYTSL